MADQRIQYTEQMVGAGHPSLADTLNRMMLVEHATDGSHTKLSGALTPAASDGASLGTTAKMWSDLFLASGAVINFDNGDVTVTHASNTLTFAGATSGYAFNGFLDVNSPTGSAFSHPVNIGSSGGSNIRLTGRNSAPADEATIVFQKYDGTTYHGYIGGNNGKLNLAGGTTLTMTLSGGNVGIGTTSPSSPLYVVGNVSADSFTDRTPHFDGDALSLIRGIRGHDGEIDHGTIPDFARTMDDAGVLGRDLGAMITLQTVAIQQLLDRVEALEKRSE
jgi:hypothetical protein